MPLPLLRPYHTLQTVCSEANDHWDHPALEKCVYHSALPVTRSPKEDDLHLVPRKHVFDALHLHPQLRHIFWLSTLYIPEEIKPSLSVSCSDRRLNDFEIFSLARPKASSSVRSTFPHDQSRKGACLPAKVLATIRGGDAGCLLREVPLLTPVVVWERSWKAAVTS